MKNPQDNKDGKLAPLGFEEVCYIGIVTRKARLPDFLWGDKEHYWVLYHTWTMWPQYPKVEQEMVALDRVHTF